MLPWYIVKPGFHCITWSFDSGPKRSRDLLIKIADVDL